MPSPVSAPSARPIDDLLLSANDVGVVDRATLSLWHCRQLLRPVLSPLISHDKPPESEEKEPPEPPPPTVELEDGMSVAAVAFADGQDVQEEPEVVVPVTRSRLRRASVTESEISLDDEIDALTASVIHARVTMTTNVALLYRRYRCVLCLDASPSVLAIDGQSGKVFLDMLYESAELFVWNLLQPMEVGNVTFTPEVHLSVMVQGAYVDSVCVLVQGFVLDRANADRLLQLIRDRLTLLEDEWASSSVSDQPVSTGKKNSKHRASLSSMLQNAVFALNSLPSGAAPLIVLATDGVVDLQNAYTYDNLVMQLVRHDIQCHFLRIGGSPWNDPNASFGYVPDIDLLEFVAQVSSGSVVEYVSLHQTFATPPVRDTVKCMSTFQSTLLIRPSKVQAISAPMLKLDMMWCASFDGNQYMPLRPYRMWREKVHEYRIQTDVHRIVEARIREGFTINKVHVQMMQRLADGSLVKLPLAPAVPAIPTETASTHAATKILLVFVLQWKQNVWLEYVISSTIENQSSVRASSSTRSASTKSTATGGANSTTGGQLKKDRASSEWYVKVNVLADGEFLRAFENSRADPQTRKTSVEAPGTPMALHDFIRNVQDVDRVLLHLMTAAASVIKATDVTAHFSFGSQVNSITPTASSKNQASHPVFGIIGELSPVLWHRWFHVDRFEVLAVVMDDPSPQTFYPRGVSPQVIPRSSAMSQTRGLPPSRARQSRMALEANMHPLLFGKDYTVERIRAAILRWSSQRLGKDLFLRFLTTESLRPDDRSKHTATPTPTGGVSTGKRRQQRSSLNSATLSAQINASMEQTQLHSRHERSKGALCFVRIEAKNHTLVVIHVAFFSASASTRRETLAELKSIVASNDVHSSMGQGSHGGMSVAPLSSSPSRKLVLCHRMLSRLLVTHDTLALEDVDNLPESTLNSDKPMVACCGGSELQLRSVFGAFMWHSSWKWRLPRSSNRSITEVMRHLHEARLRAGFWVLDWSLEEDGESMRIASVIFGREILMEDENGHLKTSLIQYGITRTTDNCLLTSFWMEPQYGYAKSTLASEAVVMGMNDAFHSSLRHAVGHDIPLSKLAARSPQSALVQDDPSQPLGDVQASLTYLDEGKLLGLIRDFIFDADRHLLSCLHTFETVTSAQEGGVDAVTQRYANATTPVVVGRVIRDEASAGCSALAPAFSTARLLEASKRSIEHFLMYLERAVPSPPEIAESDSAPMLSSANVYLYSMLERTLQSLSDCEVAWTDFNGAIVSDVRERSTDCRAPTIASQLPLWFSRIDNTAHQDRQLNQGRCFAKLLPNDTVVLVFLPALSTLLKKISPTLSPSAAKKISSNREAGLARWHQRHQLKTTSSVEVGDLASAQSSMLKMSASADDIVLYQERRESFREGYKSWRMGHFQGAKDDKTHRTGHSGQLSPHPKVASFSEDYEFCDSVCRDADLGRDFHLLIEKADGELGSGYFQVAFYECSLAQLTASLTAQTCYDPKDSREALLTQLFARRAKSESSVESTRAVPTSKRGAPTAFGSRAGGTGVPPPSPLSVSVEPPREEINLAVLHSSMTFRKKVKRAHEHNFSRGVYMALRDGAPVQQSDLIQALSSCVEVPMDLDITLLYRMLQVDMIRETVPRSALRSSMIDMLSGKSILDALRDRLDKSLESILSVVFQGIADTKYFVFVGSENMPVDDVVGVADSEVDGVQLLVDEDMQGGSDGIPAKPPLLVKSITIATDTAAFSGLAGADDESLTYEEGVARETLDSGLGSVSPNADTVVGVREALLSDQEEHQQHISQEEDAELNKDVAAATSSFSSPFFFRFECKELVKETPSRPRSTSSGVNNFDLANPAPKSALPRSASSKSFLNPMGTTANHSNSNVLPVRQKTSADKNDRADAVPKIAAGGISEIAEWAAKLSGPTIALRLVTLTLPNEQLLERTRGHHIGVDVDDKRQKVTAAELFSSLPFFQRQVLKRMRKSIKEWSSVEILRILRNVECITPAISQLVQKLFLDLPEEYRTIVRYPLNFVDIQQESVDPLSLLEKELRLGTDSIHLVDCGGVYFVVDQQSEASYKVPFWAFFTVEKDQIVLQLHHHSAGTVEQTLSEPNDRLAVLTSLHLGINAVCKRVNQFLLLLQLHESRSCNELLLPADPGTASADQSSPTAASTRRQGSFSTVTTFFWPGQFECDRKFAAFFRLNERMVPSIALTTLCTQALEQFQVHNRRHVFVYRDRGGHVYYMKMSVADSDALCQPAKSSLLRRSSSNVSNGGTPSGILLEVFGVSSPGEEVTEELCKLLERKLDETMQLILMKLLARNAKFQLSATDMAFMCPPGSSPASSVVYKVPSNLVFLSDAPTVLLFLCQTLAMTSYMRQINTSQQSMMTAATTSERRSSRRSTSNTILGAESRVVIKGSKESENAAANAEAQAYVEHPAVDNSSTFHPALFQQQGKLSAKFLECIVSKADTISPVFFSVATGGENSSADDQNVSPTVLGYADFAVNLNSELRLSPGFLSRVGKGLAILRIEVLQCDGGDAALTKDGSEMTTINVGKVFKDVSSTSVNSTSLFVRCQLWVRGPIQVTAFRSVYEAHLRESLCDYATEVMIRNVRQGTCVRKTESDKLEDTRMSQDIDDLVNLLDASAQMSSTSVTKLSLPVPIPCWDIGGIASQMHKFLVASLPVQARPSAFETHGLCFLRVDVNDHPPQKCDRIKMIPVPPNLDHASLTGSAGGTGGLVSSDSVQSELSEVDSVFSYRHSIDSSTIESLSSTSMHLPSSTPVSTKEFATSELMLYSMAKGGGTEMAKTQSPPRVQQRSFFYVIDVSVTGGLVFHGYNLSQQVVDTIALHLARVLTWALLRDRMLQGLLLQRSGVGYAAPSGASVVHPRLLLSNGGPLATTEFSVNYIAFQTAIVPILQAFNVIPKSIETTCRLDITPFGKLLKDIGIQIIDKGELQRNRSRNLAPTRPSSDEVPLGRSGSLRSGIVPSGSSQRSLGGASDKAPLPKPGGGATVPSPTKRASSGGLTPALSIGPNGGQHAGPNAATIARMRSNPTAANALMAARARARGGGFPGKMGGGPGVGSSRAPGEVAPWDLPVTNTKTLSTTTSGNQRNLPNQQDTSGRASSGSQAGTFIPAGSNGKGDQQAMKPQKRPSGSKKMLDQIPPAGRSESKGANTNTWRSILTHAWGPHYKYCTRNTFVQTAVAEEWARKKESGEATKVRASDPIQHYGSAFQRQLHVMQSCSAATEKSMELFRRVQETPADAASIGVVDEKAVETMIRTGHVIFHQRYRVSYIERWEVVKIDDEYVDDGSNTGRLRALQASMDLVNLLSYKQEFVFSGNERVVAELLTEHTIQAMCGKEGQAVREMKMQILKAVFHSRMEVVQRFSEQYATHLRTLGFHHLEMASSRKQASASSLLAPTGYDSGSASGSVTPTRSSVDAFASEGEAFSEFFVHRGGIVKGSWRGPHDTTTSNILVLELKCDHTGVLVSVVLLNEQDLKQQQLGHQRHLDATKTVETDGSFVKMVSESLRETLTTRMLIHDFTIRFFHRCLLDWTLRKPDPSTTQRSSNASSFHNMVRGIRCFLRSYPRSPSEKSWQSECALEATTVEVPVRNLQSDFSESILVKILLRYIACHGSRYDVIDLTQFGTPDTIACHSAAGTFFSRQNSVGASSSSSSSSWYRGTRMVNPGYSLLITTQELWKGKKRPKNSVLLALVRSAPSSAIVLSAERALQEAELYVKELFRAAAANYERDLLWSRLLHNDHQGPSSEVAKVLSLPYEYFRVEVGPQQLEECLRLSVCIPLQQIDPELNDLLDIEDVCWQEFALRLRDEYAGQVREYQFDGQAACHFLLLCPDARDLMIHLTFPSGINNATLEGDANRVHIDICRREEPPNHKFSLPQRRVITSFVNTVVHWLWRCLLYD